MNELLGVTLEQYGGIEVALAEGFDVEAVLANESLARSVWDKARRAWASKLSREGAGSALDKAFREATDEARRWLGRRVDPLDRDLAAFVAFLCVYARHEAPAELLRASGMLPRDLTALQAAWGRRCAADEQLQRRRDALLAERPTAVPPIRVEPAVLRPYRWSRPRRAIVETPAPSVPAPGPLPHPPPHPPAQPAVAPVQVKPSFVLAEEARHRAPAPADVAETADITSLVPRAPLPFTVSASPPAAAAPASAAHAERWAPSPDSRPEPAGSGTEDITSLVPRAAMPFAAAAGAQAPPPAPDAARPRMRLVRFDPQTGQPLAEPRWEPLPPEPQKR